MYLFDPCPLLIIWLAMTNYLIDEFICSVLTTSLEEYETVDIEVMLLVYTSLNQGRQFDHKSGTLNLFEPQRSILILKKRLGRKTQQNKFHLDICKDPGVIRICTFHFWLQF